MTVADPVVGRIEGSQRALYSVSDRFFVQAFGARLDEPVRKALGTKRPPCGPIASQDLTRAVAGCARTEAKDATGVTTTDGRHGIVDDTYASASAVHDRFILVRRGVALGDTAKVEFRLISKSAPASTVGYDVTAAPWTSHWGAAAFTLGVKPIAFANSCWKLIVDGTDTGILLAVGG